MTQRIIPPLLTRGATISVVAPAGIADRERLEAGIAYLRSMGFGVRTYRDVCSQNAIFAGDDAARAQELMQAFADPSSQAIFATRGGYGCIRLLQHLDFSQFAAHPKIFLGYSDNTVLHTALGTQSGLVTFHGPHVIEMRKTPGGKATGGMSSQTAVALWRMLMVDGVCPADEDPYGEGAKGGRATAGGAPDALALPEGPLRTISPGVAEAPVVGGNLALVCALLGTEYQIDTRGKILFLEDVDEPPYRIDRLLQQLRLSGCLDHVSGVLLGSFTRCGTGDGAWTTDEVLTEHFESASYPVLAGYPAGHGDHNLTFPLGVNAMLDASAGVFRLLEEPWSSR